MGVLAGALEPCDGAKHPRYAAAKSLRCRAALRRERISSPRRSRKSGRCLRRRHACRSCCTEEPQSRFTSGTGHRSISTSSMRHHSTRSGSSSSFPFMAAASTLQEDRNTLVVGATMPSGTVKVSFFGRISIGRINAPLRTNDGTLLVASLEDLLATKLKATLDRAEAKDYRDIAAMLSAGVSLERALGAFNDVRQGPGPRSSRNRFFQGWRSALTRER